MEKEPDWESMVMGRIQAVDFVGSLKDDWRKMAMQYRELGRDSEAAAYDECAEMLETRIEDFSRTKQITSG